MANSENHDWAGADARLSALVREKKAECLAVYQASRDRIREDYRGELAIKDGGYGHRQVFELIQNAADAILRGGDTEGRVELRLTPDYLYCANTGAPVHDGGIVSILHTHLSDKRGNEIGHFGLGFKSVLGITRRPQVFSRSVSFGFDLDEARRELREQLGWHGEEVPGLRLPHVLNPFAEGQHDYRLREMMDWAATIIRLPRDGERHEQLGDDLAAFPARFLLFSPHVRSLRIVDEGTGLERNIEQRVDRDVIALEEGESRTRWLLFRTEFRPDTAALADGGEFAGREWVPLAWAVQLDTSNEAGQFWAFFPTTYETTLAGIVNAPWKTNADRQGLLEGPYNEALLDAMARLIAESVPALARDDDPGATLDLLPARAQDHKNWADLQLNEQIYRLLADVAFLPDSQKQLHRPGELNLLAEGLVEHARSYWEEMPERPQGWAHTRTNLRERRPRALRSGARDGTLVAMLEDVARDGTPTVSTRALELAWLALGQGTVLPNHPVRAARIVLTADGRLVAPDPKRVYFAGSADTTLDLPLVHREVFASEPARALLEALGIKQVDPLLELQRIAPAGWWDAESYRYDWEGFWHVASRVEPDRLAAYLRQSSFLDEIRIRSAAGHWLRLWDAVLPGEIVAQGDTENARVLVSIEYHLRVLPVLESLGLSSAPTVKGLLGRERSFRSYRRDKVEVYQTRPGSTPQEGKLRFEESEGAGPLWSLDDYSGLRGAARERYIDALLPLAAAELQWTMYHETQAHYGRMQFESPAQWLIRTTGSIPTSLGFHEWKAAGSQELARWAAFLPVAPPEASFLPLKASLADFPEELIEEAVVRTLQSGNYALAWAFYVEASGLIGPPPAISARCGTEAVTLAPQQVHVTADRRVFELMCEQGKAAIIVGSPEAVTTLVERWHMLGGNEETTETVRFVASGPGEPLADRFPGLPRGLLHAHGEKRLTPCSSLWLEVATIHGTRRDELPFAAQDELLLFADMFDADGEALLMAANDHLGWGLTAQEVRRALEANLDAERRALVERSAATTDLAEKVAVLLDSETLRRHLPQQTVDALEGADGQVEPRALASALLAIHGTGALRAVREALDMRGLQPPRQWAGNWRALGFVRSLGFPDEFAGTRTADQPPWVEVDGPIVLNRLHDFQVEISDRIGAFLREPVPGRALVSLPTGSGKTRVVVESLVREFAEGRLSGAVIWLADRGELCEQAVVAWTECWRAFGPPGRLRVSRLWGSTNERVEVVRERNHVIVATFQSLVKRIDRWDWLGEAACIVVDEAHGSVTPSYTHILGSLDMDARRTSRPLIGLTATPFRGRAGGDTSETERLVKRYGGNRLDQDIFPGDDAHAFLQDKGILSRAEFDILAGSEQRLDRQELDFLERFRDVPTSLEQRLVADQERNETILSAIERLPSDWPVIVFAMTVPHANMLAALLSVRGIEARAIHGESDPAARRDAIRQFRDGKIRVLTNYNVLTTGFDAPQVRAIVITRPIYSPGLYQQIVGRGLRGPLNGGTDRCLILNVEDNFFVYQEQLAFREFEHLWRKVGPSDWY